MNRTYLYSSLILLTYLISCSNKTSEHQYTGILEGTVVQVPALTPGQVTEIYIATGEYVETGVLLAIVDSTELIYQAEQLL